MLQALRAAGGQIGQFVDRMEAEEALRTAEARFRALCDQSADFIRIVDAEGIIRYANPPHERLLGFPAAELVGQSSFALMHPDDVLPMRSLLAQAVREPDSFSRGELRMRHADGSWRAMEVVLQNRLDDPAVQGVLSNARDISERLCAGETLQR
jgi:PAS domain S-box-containing protein